MMNKNNIPDIPAEKFAFVGVDGRLHDQKFETKQVSYWRDAFHRFCKNKSSVVAAIIILCLLLSAFYTLIGLAAGIVVDLSYGFIDPRIRMGSKK